MSAEPRPRVLVVAATAAEAAYVPADLPLVITGVGKTAAAARTARALAEFSDVEDLVVVNIGTAGALREGLNGLFEPGIVLNHDMSAEAIRALGIDPEERLVVGRDDIILASGDVFVTESHVRETLAGQAHLVDMEGYAVAWVAREFGRTVHLVKHVSDNADDTAWDWVAAVDHSAQALGAWLGHFSARQVSREV